MYIKNRAAALIFRVILLCGCAYGMITMSGLFQGRFNGRMFVYYTNISNILCFAYMFAAALHTLAGICMKRGKGSGAPLPRLKKAFTLMISVTIVVYHFILGPAMYRMNTNYEVFSMADVLVHYFTPSMFILDWVLFDKKDTTRWFEPLTWLIIPFAYFIFIVIRAEVAAPLNAYGIRYPYYFLDFDLIGTSTVLGYVGLCILAVTALGYVFMLLDRLPSIIRPRAAAHTGRDIDA